LDVFHQTVADKGYRAEQRNDDLRPPVRHLAPWQQVAGEGLRHQHEEYQHADDPQELSRLLVGAVEHRAEHVQVHDDEEEGCTRRMHVADEPAEVDVPHDVFHRREGLGGRRLVVHRQENAGHQLDDQHHQRQHPEHVPDIEILGRVIFRGVVSKRFQQWETIVDPPDKAVLWPCHFGFDSSHYAAPASLPIILTSSWMNRYGGTRRLVGAGTPLYTRPARSKREPWQGQKKPPCQSGAGPTWNSGSGAHPRCVQFPSMTRYSGWMERYGLTANSCCCSATSEFGSRSKSGGVCSRFESIAWERRNTNTSLPRQITRTISPGSSDASGTSTGAPRAWARALGLKETRNGIEARAMPTPPVTAVATVKK